MLVVNEALGLKWGFEDDPSVLLWLEIEIELNLDEGYRI